MPACFHPWVAFGVLPLFAFANAGVRFAGIEPAVLLDPIQLGVALGLFFGKQLGVAGSIWLAIRCGFGALPEGADWRQVHGVALLTGVGFTMSLFIGTLAFPAEGYDVDIRIAVLLASMLSAICGDAVLRVASPASSKSPSAESDRDDLVGFGAARGRDLDAVADALADERTRQRRGHREPAVADVGLVLADDLKGLLLVGLLVRERDGRAELDHRARQLGDVDDLGAGDLVLELDDPALDEALPFARRVVFGVLREIAVLARFGDGADDRRPLDGFQPLQLSSRSRL